VLDYSPYALPSSAGRPLPTPRIYLSQYLLVVYPSLFDHFHLSCLVCVPRSTGYGPRPDAILDDFSRQILSFFAIKSQSDPAALIPYLSPTSFLARRFSSARHFQEARNPIAYKHPANRNPTVILTSGHPLHPLLSLIQISKSASPSLVRVFFSRHC
jgi:hypothetical protein